MVTRRASILGGRRDPVESDRHQSGRAPGSGSSEGSGAAVVLEEAEGFGVADPDAVAEGVAVLPLVRRPWAGFRPRDPRPRGTAATATAAPAIHIHDRSIRATPGLLVLVVHRSPTASASPPGESDAVVGIVHALSVKRLTLLRLQASADRETTLQPLESGADRSDGVQELLAPPA